MRENYIPTIGLEIHAELRTASKMFCSCKNDPDEKRPNTNICPICLGHPGTLPVINKEAVRHVLKIGVALNGKLADFTEWDRKQYFYPDIPKGYQISQYAYPLVTGGELAGVALERIHLEEDTAQSTHDAHENSLINFNRSGVPLLELVTKPVIHDAATATRFAKELQLLLRYLGAGEANMEKGEMRVEANISVMKTEPANEEIANSSPTVGDSGTKKHPPPPFLGGESEASGVGPHPASEEGSESAISLFVGAVLGDRKIMLGTKTEVKNLNSFRAVEKAIEFEIERHIEILERGEKVVQETRGWDDRKEETYSQRSKESAHDYRYFPEPDIPKMKLSEIGEFSRDNLKEELPELPWKRRARFAGDYGATEKEARVFADDPGLADYFDGIIKAGKGLKTDPKAYARTAMNYLLTDYLGATKSVSGKNGASSAHVIAPAHWAELVVMILDGKLSSRGAKDTLAKMVEMPTRSPKEIAAECGFMQQNDPAAFESAVRTVIDANPAVVSDYKGGKTVSLQFLIGQAMKATKGSANPSLIRDLLIKLLE